MPKSTKKISHFITLILNGINTIINQYDINKEPLPQTPRDPNLLTSNPKLDLKKVISCRLNESLAAVPDKCAL